MAPVISSRTLVRIHHWSVRQNRGGVTEVFVFCRWVGYYYERLFLRFADTCSVQPSFSVRMKQLRNVYIHGKYLYKLSYPRSKCRNIPRVINRCVASPRYSTWCHIYFFFLFFSPQYRSDCLLTQIPVRCNTLNIPNFTFFAPFEMLNESD